MKNSKDSILVAHQELRHDLIQGLPVTEIKVDIGQVATTMLVGGKGPDIILLHGPGENAFWWLRLFPFLTNNFRVIAPDFPGHAGSRLKDGTPDSSSVIPWLEEIITNYCSTSPVVIGHALGGAIAARLAIHNSKILDRLVLVDSLGLSKFRPALRFAFELMRFSLQPTERNSLKFLSQCIYDLEKLRVEMGDNWYPFLQYNLLCAIDKNHQLAAKILMKDLGLPKIPDSELKKIAVPTSMIWGRHDLAIKLVAAEKISQKLNWPLFVIDDCRDDPKLERPDAFVKALHEILNLNGGGASA